MIQIENNEAIRVNARKTDAFDIFNFKFYIGANPYLNTRSLIFDLALTGNSEPLPIEDYVSIISDRYPHLGEQNYESYAHLFARTVAEVGKLEMGLHLDRTSVASSSNYARIGVRSLHEGTTRKEGDKISIRRQGLLEQYTLYQYVNTHQPIQKSSHSSPK